MPPQRTRLELAMTLTYESVQMREACMVCSLEGDRSEFFAANPALTMAGARSNLSEAPDRGCEQLAEPGSHEHPLLAGAPVRIRARKLTFGLEHQKTKLWNGGTPAERHRLS